MTTATMKLVENALALPVEERVVLAQCVWDSVEYFVDREIEKAWLDEAEKR